MNDDAEFQPNWWCVDTSALHQPDSPINCIYNDPRYKIVKRTIPHDGHEECGFRDATGRVIPFDGDWYQLWQ